MSNLSNTLLQKILNLVPLRATGPGAYVATMTTILSDSYSYLVDNLNHTKNLKLKDHTGRDAADCYDAISENVESLESDGTFKPKHLGYIINIFDNTSNSRFISGLLRSTRRLWNLLRNLYCVTNMLCKQMISLSMVSLQKKSLR